MGRFFDVGEPNRHSQQMQLNYELPFDKFPFLNFISAQYTYTSNFDWQRGGDALIEVAGENINTVQNANTHTLTANLTMQNFYDFIGLKKRGGKGATSGIAAQGVRVMERKKIKNQRVRHQRAGTQWLIF